MNQIHLYLRFTGPCDVDLAVAAYTKAGILGACAFDKSCIGRGVIHSGDTGNDTTAIDETILIDYTQMPPDVEYLFTFIAIENSEFTLADFTELRIQIPELNLEYNLLGCGQSQARIFLPYAFVRNGDTTVFKMEMPNLLSPDTGLAYAWPLAEIALKKFMSGDGWDQHVALMPKAKAMKKDEEIMLYHQKPAKIDGKTADKKVKKHECTKYYFQLGWETKADLDSHAYELDAEGNIICHVYHGNKTSDDHAVELDGDDLTGSGDEDAPDETIRVRTDKISSKVKYIVFGIQIYSGASNFSEINKEFIRVCKKHKVKKLFGTTMKEEIIAKYELDRDNAFDSSNAAIMCVLHRVGRSWKFGAVAIPTMKNISAKVLKDLIMS